MSASVAICCRGVTREFGRAGARVRALAGLDWDVAPGEMTFLVGPSGCGKTTLLSIMAAILEPTAGEVTVFGHRLSQLSKREKAALRAQRIGFVFQQYNLLPALTAVGNAAVPLVIGGVARRAAERRAADLLEQLGMGHRLHARPAELSGGEQQRVAFARALVHDPSLIICDEPTSALDAATGHTLMELLRQTALRPDRAVVVVTHDSRIFSFADQIAWMNDGQIERIESRALTPTP
jgi:putative ABC transport system ATP-binding protein